MIQKLGINTIELETQNSTIEELKKYLDSKSVQVDNISDQVKQFNIGMDEFKSSQVKI